MVYSSERVVLITGGSSEIGSVLVRQLLACEYQVCAQFGANKKPLEGFIQNKRLALYQQDLSTAEGAEALVNRVLEDYGRIDVLVNTIGPLLLKNLGDLTPKEWADQIHLNLNLAFYLSHFAKDHLIRTKGQMIFFSFAGVDFLKSRLDSTAYCAAKAGIQILTKSWASLLAPYSVRVNAISPGLVEEVREGDNKPEKSEEEREKMAKEIPAGRPGSPEEIAQVLIWLIDKSPSYVTGAAIPVSGAWEYV